AVNFNALLRRGRTYLLAAYVVERRQLFIIDALVAAGDDHDGLAVDNEGEAFGDLPQFAADVIRRLLGGGRRLLEETDLNAQVKTIQGGLNVLRGQRLHDTSIGG